MGDQNAIDLRLQLHGLAVVEQGMRKLHSAIGAIGTIVVGSALLSGLSRLSSFLTRVGGSADAMGDLADAVGATTQEMSRLSFATKKSSDEMQGMVRAFAGFLSERGQGSRNITEALLETADAFQKLPEGSQRAAFAVERFGRSGLDMIEFLGKGRDGIQELLDRGDKLGVFTKENAEQSEKFTDALNESRYASKQLGFELATVFLPTMTKVITAMADGSGALRRFVNESPAARAAIEALTVAFAAFAAVLVLSKLSSVAALSSLATTFAVLTKIVIAAGVGFAGFKIGEAIGGITLLGASIKDHIVAALLEARIAWLGLMQLMGRGKHSEEILNLQKEVYDLRNPQAAAAEEATARTPGTGIQSKEQLDLELKRLDVVRERYQFEQKRHALLGGDIRDEEEFSLHLNSIYQEAVAILTQEMRIKEAIKNGILTELEGEKALLKVRGEFLENLAKNNALLTARFNLLRGEADLQQKITQANLDHARALINSDFTKTDAQKFEEKRRLLELEREVLLERQRTIRLQLEGDLLPENRKALEGDLRGVGSDLQRNQQQQGQQGPNPDNFSQQMGDQLTQLQNQFGTVSQNIAKVITGGIGTALDTVATQITNLIDGTATWGQAFAQVAKSIIASIIKIILQWIISMTLLAVLKRIFGTTDKMAAASSAAAWAPAAIAASTASFGAAAAAGATAFGVALVSGTALAVGMSAAGAGFSEGGYTGAGGKYQPAGMVHRGEFVFDAGSVSRIGVPALEAMRGNAAGGGGGAAPSVNVGGPKITMVNVNSREEMRQVLQSSEGRIIIRDELNRLRGDLGIDS